MTAQQKHSSTKQLGLSTLAARLGIGLIFDDKFGILVFEFTNTQDLNSEWRFFTKADGFYASAIYPR